ncbi:hypothetical protein QTN47_24425 [Danxiaibacter flavus]|uniref:Cytochrome P460 domain-containing protein n=1 Tax=Danxiaibacter flavus TaxID=3049108 RepID=A0ABV3ZMG1_9BACT|nr:hypothetical protein QNM32_24430 [Chitinophagaceae bacterium DXS]
MKTGLIVSAAVVLMASCKAPVAPDKIVNNQASLPASFSVNNMHVITSSINKRQQTMSTLYGNRIAVDRARSGKILAAGEQLVLVVWKQKPDENWFGANIPDKIESIEQVSTGNDPSAIGYKRYEGNPLALVSDTTGNKQRIVAIIAQQASVMP